jgi:uncharacterized repeat protein (TIGR01451 family)
MKRVALVLVMFLTGMLLSALAQGAIVQYDDRASWLAAVGGTPDVEEDFQGFTVDTSFRAAPVAISMGTIAQVGLDQAFRNLVDVAPFEYTDNNGTTHASCFVNYPDSGPGSETNVEVTFSAPVSAWGADFNGILGGELLAIDVDGTTEAVIATLLPTAGDTFLGFVATAGEQIDKVIYRSQNQNTGGAGEGFGSDNFAAIYAAPAAGADVSGTKTSSGDLFPGGTVFYQVVLINNGTGDQADNPTDEFVDTLPAELTLVDASASSGAVTLDLPGNSVSWNGAIAVGASVTIDIQATINSVAPGTVVTNQGDIFFDGDGNGTNESQGVTDDPAQPGATDPTVFAVEEQRAIPTLNATGQLVLLVLLAGIGIAVLRWRRG